MSVVTIDELNAALRLDLATDGNSPPAFIDTRMPEVEMKLAEAEDIVRDFLKIDASAWPPDNVPDRFRSAIWFAFKALFDDRPEWIADLHAEHPTGPIAGCLRSTRVPTLA